MPPSKNISFEELSKYFHLPINQVAKELGVCATILKKICRRNGIPRWPHRKIKSLDKMIANLELNLSKNPAEKEEINEEVEMLRTKKLEIMKNPDILVSKNSNRSKNFSRNLNFSMKKTKTIRNNQQDDITGVEENEYYSSEEQVTNWKEPSYIPKVTTNMTNKSHILSILAEPVNQHLVASRRPSLPILSGNYFHQQTQPVVIQQQPSSPINLPVPIRRHSMGEINLKNSNTFSITGSGSYSVPSVDFSQKLAAFQFREPNGGNKFLPCIEPQMNSIEPQMNSIEPNSKNAFPDWFLAEKNRILGADD